MVVHLQASQAAEALLKLPDGRDYQFHDRDWLRGPFDTQYRSRLLMAGRQVGKTSSIGALLGLKCISEPFHSALYVAPRQRQAQDFSKDKLSKILSSPAYSREMFGDPPPDLHEQIDTSNAVLDKVFANGSHIKLRYAYRSADQIRGITAKTICLDECQDLLTDHIWVILECQSSFPFEEKTTMYAGTPKTYESSLHERWEQSTQNEWCMRCVCGKWQFIERNNIADDTRCTDNSCGGHIICRVCGRGLNPRFGKWVAMGPGSAGIDGYRMPQVLNPVTDWHGENGVISKAERMSDQLFHNEVLALPYDVTSRVFSVQDLQAACNPSLSISGHRWLPGHVDVVAGVDWAEVEGGVSRTVLTIGAWMSDNTFKVVYTKMYEDKDPEEDLEDIIRTCLRWGCTVVGCDQGAGRFRNKILVRRLSGKALVIQYYYPASVNDNVPKVTIKKKTGVAKLNRNKTLDDIVDMVKRKQIEFPRWDQWKPFAEHFKYVRQDWDSSRRCIYYDHPSTKPDDAFHSTNYAVTAGRIWRGEVNEAA